MAVDRNDERDRKERQLDAIVEDSFPASDPASHGVTTGVGRRTVSPKPGSRPPRPPSHQRGDDERPAGHPNSDRHATETAHQWEDEGGA